MQLYTNTKIPSPLVDFTNLAIVMWIGAPFDRVQMTRALRRLTCPPSRDNY